MKLASVRIGARASLLAAVVSLLAACNDDGGSQAAAPAPLTPGLTPAATVATNGRLTLEQQERATAAGAQLSQSPRFTLINEGVSR